MEFRLSALSAGRALLQKNILYSISIREWVNRRAVVHLTRSVKLEKEQRNKWPFPDSNSRPSALQNSASAINAAAYPLPIMNTKKCFLMWRYTFLCSSGKIRKIASKEFSMRLWSKFLVVLRLPSIGSAHGTRSACSGVWKTYEVAEHLQSSEMKLKSMAR
jgi:hypothetical protein